jgi:multicomponent Na+:H+ antiporter subunit F
MHPTLYIILMILFAAAFILTLIRLTRGPTLADRVIAFDLVGIIAAGILALYGIHHCNPYYLDIITVLAMILFFSTVALAAYIEKQKPKSDIHDPHSHC